MPFLYFPGPSLCWGAYLGMKPPPHLTCGRLCRPRASAGAWQSRNCSWEGGVRHGRRGPGGPPSRAPHRTWSNGAGSPSLSSRLALKMLCLARRQQSLLQAAKLLTPDMIAEFETLQQLVQEGKAEPGAKASGAPGPAREAPLEPCPKSGESRPCSVSSSALSKAQLAPRGGWGLRCWVMLWYTGLAAHLWS